MKKVMELELQKLQVRASISIESSSLETHLRKEC